VGSRNMHLNLMNHSTTISERAEIAEVFVKVLFISCL
jgi:hypothetical protein